MALQERKMKDEVEHDCLVFKCYQEKKRGIPYKIELWLGTTIRQVKSLLLPLVVMLENNPPWWSPLEEEEQAPVAGWTMFSILT